MTPIQAVIAKELRSYFVSPVVYVVAGVFLFIFGFLAHLYVKFIGAQAIQLMQMQGGAAEINLNDLLFRNLFASTRFVLLLILPILTMRLFAEERKLRTFEFLMTAPLRTVEIVVGKFLGAYLIYLGMLVFTMLVPAVLTLFSHFDWYPVLTGYLGLALLGAFFLSVGVFASTLTENQVVAAFTSFGLLLVFWLLSGLGSVLGDTAGGALFSYLSFMEHFDHLIHGLIDTKDLVYYASGVVFMLFLSHQAVESTRWK